MTNLKLSFKNFMSKKIRNMFVALGSAIGIIGILLALGLGSGINNGINKMFSSVFSPSAVQVKAFGGAGQETPNLTEAEIIEITALLKDNGIQEVNNEETYQGISLTYNGESIKSDQEDLVPTSFFMQNLNISQERIDSYSVENKTLVAGEAVKNNSDDILINRTMASNILKIDPLEMTQANYDSLIGETIQLNLTVRSDKMAETHTIDVTITGILESSPVPTLFYASNATFTSIEEASNKGPSITTVSGYANTAEDAEAFGKAFDGQPNKDETVVSAYEKEISKKYTVSTASDIMGQITSLTNVITYTLAFAAGLSLIVAAVMISIVLYIGVIERTKEIGVLRSIGYTKSNIRNMFLFESMLIIVLANIIGVAIALLLGAAANPALELSTGFDQPFAIGIEHIAITLLITIAIGVFAGIFPSMKAAKLDPVEALRYE